MFHSLHETTTTSLTNRKNTAKRVMLNVILQAPTATLSARNWKKPFANFHLFQSTTATRNIHPTLLMFISSPENQMKKGTLHTFHTSISLDSNSVTQTHDYVMFFFNFLQQHGFFDQFERLSIWSDGMPRGSPVDK